MKTGAAMGDKSVETLCSKIEFLSTLVTFPPFPQKQFWFFYFFDCTDHSAYTTLNWGAGGIRVLTLQANEIEKMLKYRKRHFLKVSQLLLSPIVVPPIFNLACPATSGRNQQDVGRKWSHQKRNNVREFGFPDFFNFCIYLLWSIKWWMRWT